MTGVFRKAAGIIVCLAGLAAGALCAAEQGGREARFRQLDSDGDGRLSAGELPRGDLFKAMDADGDGFVTMEEGRAHFAARVRAAAKGGDAREPASSPDVATAFDVPYAQVEGVEAKALSLDIHAPKEAKGRPVLVWIHGGGWKAGDKSNVGLKPAFFTGKGWLLVSINYRLLPAGRHPVNVEDVAAALAWVHGNIARHGGDAGAIFVGGHSAGAHLASLVATDERPLRKCGQSLSLIRGVVSLDTNAYDIPKLMASGPAAVAYGATFGDDPAIQKDASPLHHVAGGKGVPPFIVFYSHGIRPTGEVELRSGQAGAFREALRGAGIRAELVPATDRNHGEINKRFGDPEDNVTRAAWTFLESLARSPGTR